MFPNTYSQQNFNLALGDSINKNTKLKSERFRSMWDGKIKGSRYLNDKFILGKVNNENFFLRYDPYEDRFESKKNNKDEIDYVDRDISKVVNYNLLKYYYLPYYYKNKRKFNVGYLYILLDLDSIKYYKKNEVTFRPATYSPTTLEIGFPPRYVKRQLFFIQKNNQTPVQIGKRKITKVLENFSIIESNLNVQ